MVEARIAEHVKFFDHIVQLFPSSYYSPIIDDEGGAAEPTEGAAEQGSDSEDESSKLAPATNRATSMSELREKLQAKVKALAPQQAEEKPYKKRKGRKSRKMDDDSNKSSKKQKASTGKGQAVKKTKTEDGNKEQKIVGTQEEKDGNKPKKQKTEAKKIGMSNDKPLPIKATPSVKPAAKPAAAKPATQSEAKPQAKPETKSDDAKIQKKRKVNDTSIGQDLMFSSVLQPKVSNFVDQVPGSGKKNAHRALRKVEKFEEKVKKLKQKDLSLAQEAVQQANFSAALSRAQGTKVHDDKARLAKALKRKEKSKKKSQKEWSERTKAVTASKTQAAQKRNENVKNKLEERSAQRLKKSIKKRGDIRALLTS